MNWRPVLKFIFVLVATAACMYLFIYLMSTGMTRVGSALMAVGVLLIVAAITFLAERRIDTRN